MLYHFIFHLILFTFSRSDFEDIANTHTHILNESDAMVVYVVKMLNQLEKEKERTREKRVLFHFRSYYILIITYYYFGMDLCIYIRYLYPRVCCTCVQCGFVIVMLGYEAITLSVRICSLSRCFGIHHSDHVVWCEQAIFVVLLLFLFLV